MKNVAILAVILGFLGSAANAESAVNEAPLTLALNNVSTEQWAQPVNTRSVEEAIEINFDGLNEAMEEVSDKLNKQLEEKIAKELEYAMQ